MLLALVSTPRCRASGSSRRSLRRGASLSSPCRVAVITVPVIVVLTSDVSLLSQRFASGPWRAEVVTGRCASGRTVAPPRCCTCRPLPAGATGTRVGVAGGGGCGSPSTGLTTSRTNSSAAHTSKALVWSVSGQHGTLNRISEKLYLFCIVIITDVGDLAPVI